MTREGEYAENIQNNGEKGPFDHSKNKLAPTALSEQRFLSSKNWIPQLFARFGPSVISIFYRERRRSYDGFVERMLLILRKNRGCPTRE